MKIFFKKISIPVDKYSSQTPLENFGCGVVRAQIPSWLKDRASVCLTQPSVGHISHQTLHQGSGTIERRRRGWKDKTEGREEDGNQTPPESF